MDQNDSEENSINVDSLDELKLNPLDVKQAKKAWQNWLDYHHSVREDAGEAIFESMFELSPSLQGLFDIPLSAQAAKFLAAFSNVMACAELPQELLFYVERLAFQHMNIDVSPASVVIFKDAFVGVLQQDLGADFDVKAKDVISQLVMYLGGGIIYSRKSCDLRKELLHESWRLAHVEKDQEEHEESGEMEDAKVSQKQTDDDIEKQSNSSGASNDQLFGMKKMSTSLPTSFNEMFSINAAVMGFQQASNTWMPIFLETLKNIVVNITSLKRMQEEVNILLLRLTPFARDDLVFTQFKAALLAALRSTLPKVWSSSHEDAWTWLWDNLIGILEPDLEKPRLYEPALDATLKGFTPRRLWKLRKDIYARFFQLAPVGQNFFKQSNTRLHFIADRVLEIAQEFFKDPVAMVSTISALGLRHVGFGIPTDLFTPFCTACIQVMKRHTDSKTTHEAFTWSLILTANVLTRTISEGSTVVMKAINANSEKSLYKAVALAPRGERSSWVLHIQVGDQFISPLMWAIDSGSMQVAECMLKDLLTIRADRAQYYYGVDELFYRHPDIVTRLGDKAPDLLWPLLDGLIWRSHRTEGNGQWRRVNYFVKYMLIDQKGKFSEATRAISSTGDPRLMSHPVVEMLIELLWAGIVKKQFMYSRLWNIVSLVVFLLSQEILPGYIEADPGDRNLRYMLLGSRIFSYTFGIGRLGMLQTHRAYIWSRNTFRKILADIDTDGNGEIDYEEMKEAVSRFKDTVKKEVKKALRIGDEDEISAFADQKAAAGNKQSKLYNRISAAVMVLLVLMLSQEPIITCQDDYEWPITVCQEYTTEQKFRYSVLGMIAMAVHYLMLIDLAVFSTEISAFLLVVGSVMGEMTQFLTALSFLLLVFGSCIGISCRNCPTGGGDFSNMANAIISLFAITVGLYQGDLRDIQSDPTLLTLVYIFVIFSVVLLLNLLIAQLNRTFEYIYQDTIGFAQLNRLSLIVDAMQSCPTKKWKSWVASKNFDERTEFDEGDLGLAGCVQVIEPAAKNRTSVEQIQRFGGTTARSMPWPEDRKKKRTDLNEDDRYAFLEEVLQKTVVRMDRLARYRTARGSTNSGSKGGSGSSVSSDDSLASDGST
mmetsp:Transcript_16320/g.28583  ORF Transcript_16320/g.28583 Transcript_16320/m.28583 type:complete len:1108 (+) Transcript_16320:55-3378(+)